MRKLRHLVALVAILCLVGGGAEAELVPALPNLVPLPPEIELDAADEGTGLLAIRLSVAVANRGEAHLDLLGTPTGSPDEATANQCVDWAQERVCSERKEVGSFVWHPDHGHHHFEGFALYELRRLRKGRPDLRPVGLATAGNKISFCLLDDEEDNDDQTTFEGTGLTGWPFYSSCVAGSGYQGISRGWRDVYESSLEGQQIVIDGVAPGLYALVVTIDPDGRLIETSDDDNVVALKIQLEGTGLVELCVYSADFRTCEPRDFGSSSFPSSRNVSLRGGASPEKSTG